MRILYPRHFLLLTCFASLLGVMAALRLPDDPSIFFALYGALHASALILALRVRQPLWRNCLFIAVAAGLSLVTLRIGMLGMHLSQTLPGKMALYATLGFSAAIGAVIYGISIRLLGIYALKLGSLVILCAACLVAAYIAFSTLAYVHALGRWWLAILWWYAFSGGLWYCDYRVQHSRSTR